jgi:hypothetical protein
LHIYNLAIYCRCKGELPLAKHSETMEEVFAHMAGLVEVEYQSHIVSVEETYAKSPGFDQQQVIGRYVKDVIPTSRLPIVIESGKPILGNIFLLCWQNSNMQSITADQ